MPISRTKNNQYRISCKPDSGFWMVWKLANQLAEDTHNCLFSLVPRFVGTGSDIVFTGGFCSALPLGPMNSLGRGSKGEFLVSLSSKQPLCSQTLWPVIKITRMYRSKLGFPLKKWTHRNSLSLSWIDVFFEAVLNKRKQTRSFNTFISWRAGCPIWVLEKKMPGTNVFETYLLRWIDVQIKQCTMRKFVANH